MTPQTPTRRRAARARVAVGQAVALNDVIRALRQHGQCVAWERLP
jgi:hypothetical protein